MELSDYCKGEFGATLAHKDSKDAAAMSFGQAAAAAPAANSQSVLILGAGLVAAPAVEYLSRDPTRQVLSHAAFISDAACAAAINVDAAFTGDAAAFTGDAACTVGACAAGFTDWVAQKSCCNSPNSPRAHSVAGCRSWLLLHWRARLRTWCARWDVQTSPQSHST